MRRFGFQINVTVAVCLLSSSSDCAGGASLHVHCVKSELISHLTVATVVADMYPNSGCLKEARVMFNREERKDVVLYNCTVGGYAKEGHFNKRLMLLRQMKSKGLTISSGSLVGLLKSCATSGALVVSRKVCKIVTEKKLDLNATLRMSVLDMYVKCGCIDDVMYVFDMMKSKDVTIWTAMIMGLGIHGRADDALHLFSEMEKQRI